jgi:hypothetical protein
LSVMIAFRSGRDVHSLVVGLSSCVVAASGELALPVSQRHDGTVKETVRQGTSLPEPAIERTFVHRAERRGRWCRTRRGDLRQSMPPGPAFQRVCYPLNRDTDSRAEALPCGSCVCPPWKSLEGATSLHCPQFGSSTVQRRPPSAVVDPPLAGGQRP